jgi:hypothetical protein
VVVISDIPYCLDEGGAEVLADEFVGSIELCCADPKLAWPQLNAVVLAGELDQSRIAARPDNAHHLPHRGLNILQVVLRPLLKQLASLFARQLR